MTHPYPVHGFAYAVTGRPTYDPSIEFAPLHSTAWPYVGSVVDYIESKREGVTPLHVAQEPFELVGVHIGGG